MQKIKIKNQIILAKHFQQKILTFHCWKYSQSLHFQSFISKKLNISDENANENIYIQIFSSEFCKGRGKYSSSKWLTKYRTLEICGSPHETIPYALQQNYVCNNDLEKETKAKQCRVINYVYLEKRGVGCLFQMWVCCNPWYSHNDTQPYKMVEGNASCGRKQVMWMCKVMGFWTFSLQVDV